MRLISQVRTDPPAERGVLEGRGLSFETLTTGFY